MDTNDWAKIAVPKKITKFLSKGDWVYEYDDEQQTVGKHCGEVVEESGYQFYVKYTDKKKNQPPELMSKKDIRHAPNPGEEILDLKSKQWYCVRKYVRGGVLVDPKPASVRATRLLAHNLMY